MKKLAEELEFPPEYVNKYVNKIEVLNIDTVVINGPVEVLSTQEKTSKKRKTYL